MTLPATPDLDVVVLGGGGHVGLPLSLAFAEAGKRVGVYDTNRATSGTGVCASGCEASTRAAA